MYNVRLECPHDSTNRSRPGHNGSAGSCRMTFWYSRYAAGARLIAVPGWPDPARSTASMARTRMRSTVRASASDQSSAARASPLTTASDPSHRRRSYGIDPIPGAVSCPPRRGLTIGADWGVLWQRAEEFQHRHVDLIGVAEIAGV